MQHTKSLSCVFCKNLLGILAIIWKTDFLIKIFEGKRFHFETRPNHTYFDSILSCVSVFMISVSVCSCRCSFSFGVFLFYSDSWLFGNFNNNKNQNKIWFISRTYSHIASVMWQFSVVQGKIRVAARHKIKTHKKLLKNASKTSDYGLFIKSRIYQNLNKLLTFGIMTSFHAKYYV